MRLLSLSPPLRSVVILLTLLRDVLHLYTEKIGVFNLILRKNLLTKIKISLVHKWIYEFLLKVPMCELLSVTLPSIYTSTKIRKMGRILMKNFALKSKFYLLHKNVDVRLLDMPIIWLTFLGLRCIIIGIEGNRGFLAKIGIYNMEVLYAIVYYI